MTKPPKQSSQPPGRIGGAADDPTAAPA